MKKSSLLTMAFGGALLLAGCSSISSMEHRAGRYPQTWARLTPADKERVRRGEFRPGDSVKLVFIRYGAPDEVRLFFPGKDRMQSIWVWRNSPLVDPVGTAEPVDQAWTQPSPDPASSYSQALTLKAIPNQETSPSLAAKWNGEAYAASQQARQPAAPANPGTKLTGRPVPGPFFIEQGVLVKAPSGSPSALPKYQLELPEPESRLASN